MSKYKDMYYEQQYSTNYKKEGYKKIKAIVQPKDNPLDYMEIRTSAGTSVRMTRCVCMENGNRCENPGTIYTSGGGWVCGKHYRS